MYFDTSQATNKQRLYHDASVSKLGKDIVEGDKVSFQVNTGTITELGDDKYDQFIYFLWILFWKRQFIPI